MSQRTLVYKSLSELTLWDLYIDDAEQPPFPALREALKAILTKLHLRKSRHSESLYNLEDSGLSFIPRTARLSRIAHVRH